MAKKPETKKEKLEKRKKRDLIAHQARALHEEEREKMYVAKGGYSAPDKEGIDEDWVSKVGSLRSRLRTSRARVKSRGKSFFKSR